MHSEINTNDLITFSDGLKVLVMGKYVYEELEHKNAEYLLVKQVNETETIALGDAFFLEVIEDDIGFSCEYVTNPERIYSLMSRMGIP